MCIRDRNYIYLVRTNMNGDTLWTRIYGDGLSDNEGNDVVETDDNGFAVTGGVQNFGLGGKDMAFIKTDANGHSGCMERNIPGIVTPVNAMNTVLIVSGPRGSGGPSFPTFLSGPGGSDSTFCISLGMEDLQGPGLMA